MAKSEIIEKENCKRVLKVEIPPDEVKAEFDRVYNALVKNASVPGFRKGKAPLTIIKKRFEEMARGEVMRKLLSSSLYDAIREKNLEVLSEPVVEEGVLKPDEQFSYKVTMEVRPEIRLEDYNKIKLTKKIKNITHEDIDKTLKEIQERFARYQTIDKDLASGGYALVNIKITEGADTRVNREGIIIHIDDKGFGPGFSEKVKGLKKGEEREFTLKVPFKEKEEDKEIMKEINFWISLKEVKEKHVSPVDDGLAKDAGFDSLEELKKDIQKRLEDSEKTQSYHDMRRQIDEHLLSIGDLVAPQSIIKNREDSTLEMIRHNMELEGKSDEYKAREEEIRKDVRENNLKRIKLAYIMDEIGRREKIEATKEDIEQDLKGIVGDNEEELKKARESLKDEKTWENYALRVREKKIYQYFINAASIV